MAARRIPAAADKLGPAVVAIGASAGGLDAFTQFFMAVPEDTGLAFVLIQHLDPTRASLTAELLGKHTRMSVVQVQDAMRLEPNHVYVIPPNKYLAISGETLQLTEPLERRGVRVPIDFFFSSLADDRHERAIGIILSGTGTDGTLGAREIKAAGGIVIAQAPATASHAGMPQSAIAAGVVDFVLPVDRMPDLLANYTQQGSVRDPFPGQVAGPRRDEVANGSDPDFLPEPPASFEPVGPLVNNDLRTIIGLLRERTKYDFGYYKEATLTRRMQRRMGLKHVEGIGEYVALLRRDQEELTALSKDLLIGVTSFFRDSAAWQALEHQVIEPLVAAHDASSPIRAWVAGCATGQEAYSLAMLLTEALQHAEKGCGMLVFASDLDQDALAVARAGVYPENIAAAVGPERLRRFFVPSEHTYCIRREIREAVVFARQNVISNPPFSKLDLVSCRNLLIYLKPEIQDRILNMFHFALRDGGYLFLGNAETITRQPDLFEPVSRKWRIHRRLGRAASSGPAATAPQCGPPGSGGVPRPDPGPPSAWPPRRPDRWSVAAQQAVMQRFAPACALVNRQLEVLYLYGPVDEYLQLPSGERTHDLTSMARQGLRSKLRLAVQQVFLEDKPRTLDEARVRRGQQYFPVRVTIEPLRQPAELAGLVLVAFEEAGAEQRVRLIYIEPPEPPPPDTPESAAEYQAVIRQLERDLTETREDLQAAIEQFETGNEEFKAAHEEVTSINEELQSTNEELETSKEELQSLNEELQTLNSQLESKVRELESVNNDLHNLLSSIDHATLFLDRQFCIRRFTPATTQLLRVIESDVGRPFADFARNFTDEHLLADATQVLKHLGPIDKEIQDQHDRWYVRRIVPYRTQDDRIDGVVITFTEITERKRGEARLRMLNESLEQQVADRTELMRLVHDITAVANHAHTVDEALRYAVEQISRYSGWGAGQVYRPVENGSGDLVSANIWHVAEGGDLSQLQKVIGETRCARPDAGMICDAVRTAELQWADDIAISHTRSGDAEPGGGARTAIAFPILVEGRAQAVLAFCSQAVLPRDERYVAALQNVGIQLGHVLKRKASDRQMAELALAERQRMGRELHDSLGQQMSALGMLVAALRDELAADGPLRGTELLEKLESHIEQSQRQVRSLIVGLLPVDLEGRGLSAALERLAALTAQAYGVACRFERDNEVTVADSFTATQLYLIASEATHNAAKHARAREIVIRLSEDNGIRVTVTDNGIGLPHDAERASGMGLRIMRHRAGLIAAELHLESPPEGGTNVSCFVPLRNESKQDP